MASYVPITNTLNFAVSFNPTTAFPIDARSMFGSYAAAVTAAATAKNAGSSESVYYFGQSLTVFENDIATMYTIQGDGSLKEIGAVTLGDGKTIEVNNSTLRLKNFGVQYYEYHNADIIISGNYTYPDTMPAEPAENSYVKIGEIWYNFTSSTWAVSDNTPNTASYYILINGWKSGLEPKVMSTDTGDYELAWYEPSTTTFEGLSSVVSSLQNDVGTLGNRVTSTEIVANKATTDIALEVTRATAAEAALSGRTTAVEGTVTTLNGDETTAGSVKKQVADAIAKIILDAPESFDTLKEISDWISTHSEDAAGMNSSIIANATAIRAMETLVGTLPEGSLAVDIIGYVGEQISVETQRALAAESALGERIGTVETSVSKLGTAAQKNTEYFATAAQGSKADTAVQKVIAGVNGKIVVDGAEVVAYTLPNASTSEAGGIKVDGTSLSVNEGVASVEAVDKSKVTGLTVYVEGEVATAITEANDYTDINSIAKTNIVPAGGIADSVENASDEKVVSEKLLADMFKWKTAMD